jgi:tmRNA-binding protein
LKQQLAECKKKLIALQNSNSEEENRTRRLLIKEENLQSIIVQNDTKMAD